jgi:hypothetical protein
MLDSAQLSPTFHRLVAGTMRAEGVPSSEATERYLVGLLLAFVRPAHPDLLDPPLGPSLLAALQLPRSQRTGHLRRVGDTTLFLTGLFVERLERTLVGPHYYVALGQTAYSHLSHDAADHTASRAYAELATRFLDFVRVLGVIAEQHLFDRDSDVLRLYKRWFTSRGARDAAALVRRGIIPWAPDDESRRH